MAVLNNLEPLVAAQRDMAELSTELKKLLQPYLESDAETLADIVNMTVQQLQDVATYGVYGIPLAQLLALVWALDHDLRLDLVPHAKAH